MRLAKQIGIGILCALVGKVGLAQQLRLGKNPYTVEKSAVLELVSDNQGLLLPRISDTTQINTMNPPDGMIIFFSPTKQLLIRSNGSWQAMSVNASVVISLNGNTGALIMDTTYISSFSAKVRSLFFGTAPITYSNGTISITQAGSSSNGYLSSTDWNNFNNKANSFSTGNLTETGSGILTITGGTNSVIGSGTSIQVKQANTSQSGFLSSADWNTFNNKQSSGNYLSDPGSNGILARTALNTTTSRTITGTSNRISITNGDGVSGNPTIDISSSYVGQNTITTLGTVSTGVWNGTKISETYGGTNQTIYTLGDILYSSAINTLSKLAGNTTVTKKFLSQTGNGSVSAAPTWSTVTSSDIGLGNVENTALSTWVGSTNLTTLGTITTGTWNGSIIPGTYGGTGINNGTKTITLGNNFTTSGNYALTLTQTGTTNVTLPTTGTLATLNGTETFTNKTLTSSTNVLGGVTMTLGSDATYDMYYRNSSGVLTRFGIGSNGTFLKVVGGVLAWDPSSSANHNFLSSTHADVTAASVSRGDIITGQGASPTWSRLAIGSQGKILQAGANEVGYTSFKLPTSVGSAGQRLVSDGTDYVNKTITNYQASPSDPNTTTSATGVMMGLAGSITPAYSGTILIIISGDIDNTSNNSGAQVQLRYGTGTAPSNAAALTGTTTGGLVKMTENNSGIRMPFTVNTILTGLTVGTAYWIDVSLSTISGGTARIRDISISVVEL